MTCRSPDVTAAVEQPVRRKRDDFTGMHLPSEMDVGFELGTGTLYKKLGDILPQYGGMVVHNDPVVYAFPQENNIYLIEPGGTSIAFQVTGHLS